MRRKKENVKRVFFRVVFFVALMLDEMGRVRRERKKIEGSKGWRSWDWSLMMVRRLRPGMVLLRFSPFFGLFELQGFRPNEMGSLQLEPCRGWFWDKKYGSVRDDGLDYEDLGFGGFRSGFKVGRNGGLGLGLWWRWFWGFDEVMGF